MTETAAGKIVRVDDGPGKPEGELMNGTTGKPRILCADDEEYNLRLLAAVLAPLGCEAVFARSGREALAIIEKAPPAAVLLDVVMPGLGGFETLERIRAAQATRALPVVMVTSLSETGARVEALEKGADDFISKPFEKAEVAARVRSILRLEHYRARLADKEKLELVLEAVTDGICVCGPGLRVRKVNAAASRLLGPGAAGAPLPELLAREFAKAPGAEELAAARRKNVFGLARPETPAAAAAFYEMTGSRVKNALGELTDLVFTFKDITGQKKEEIVKRDFLSLISHKLHAPIASLTTGLPMLLDGSLGPLEPAQREVLATLCRQTGWLEKLFSGILEFISVTSDCGQPGLDPAGVRAVAERALASVGAAAAGVEIIEAAGGLAPLPLGENELELVLRNLIGNAVKFGGAAPAVLVELGARDGGFELSVSDRGPGIPPEEVERIFEPFSQVEKDFTGSVEGAGIGLATVKKLVELKGGTVSVLSRLGRGAKFTVKVPLAEAAEERPLHTF